MYTATKNYIFSLNSCCSFQILQSLECWTFVVALTLTTTFIYCDLHPEYSNPIFSQNTQAYDNLYHMFTSNYVWLWTENWQKWSIQRYNHSQDYSMCAQTHTKHFAYMPASIIKLTIYYQNKKSRLNKTTEVSNKKSKTTEVSTKTKKQKKTEVSTEKYLVI